MTGVKCMATKTQGVSGMLQSTRAARALGNSWRVEGRQDHNKDDNSNILKVITKTYGLSTLLYSVFLPKTRGKISRLGTFYVLCSV